MDWDERRLSRRRHLFKEVRHVDVRRTGSVGQHSRYRANTSISVTQGVSHYGSRGRTRVGPVLANAGVMPTSRRRFIGTAPKMNDCGVRCRRPQSSDGGIRSSPYYSLGYRGQTQARPLPGISRGTVAPRRTRRSPCQLVSCLVTDQGIRPDRCRYGVGPK